MHIGGRERWKAHGSVASDRLDVEEITRVDGRTRERDDEGSVPFHPDTPRVLRIHSATRVCARRTASRSPPALARRRLRVRVGRRRVRMVPKKGSRGYLALDCDHCHRCVGHPRLLRAGGACLASRPSRLPFASRSPEAAAPEGRSGRSSRRRTRAGTATRPSPGCRTRRARGRRGLHGRRGTVSAGRARLLGWQLGETRRRAREPCVTPRARRATLPAARYVCYTLLREERDELTAGGQLVHGVVRRSRLVAACGVEHLR